VKIPCKKCGYEVEFDDKLLLEGSIEYSCPSCQNPISVGDKVGPAQTEKDSEDAVKTEIFNKNPATQTDVEDEETFLKSGEDEVTLDRIAQEISEPVGQELSPELSVSSLVSELREKSVITGTPASKPTDDVPFDDKTEMKKPLHGIEAEVSIFDEKEDSGLSSSTEPAQLYNTKRHLAQAKSFSLKFKKPSPYKSKNLPGIILLIVSMIALIIFYPYISIKQKITPSKTVLSKSVSDTLSIVYLYSSFGSTRALELAESTLMQALEENPGNSYLLAELAKIYAEMGTTSDNPNLLNTALEISTENLG